MVTFGIPLWLFVLLRLLEWGLVIMMTSFWLRSMQRTMERCHPASRTMPPVNVWLTFIPLFGFVWQFNACKNTGETIANEYTRRNWSYEEGRPGYEPGAIA